MENELVEEMEMLIAGFMGARFSSEDAFKNGNVKHYAVFNYGNHPNHLIKSAGRKFEIKDLTYRASWDWLKPVVDKIKRVHPQHENVFCHHKFWELTIFSSLEEVFEGVVNYIQWYNQAIKK